MSSEPDRKAIEESSKEQDKKRATGAEQSVAYKIAYYSAAQRRSRRGFRVLSVLQIVLAALIPLAALFLHPPVVAANVAAILGASIAVAKGLDSLFQTRESYVRYAQTAVRLYAELEQYRLRVGDYKTAPDPEDLLMLRSIDIQRQENDVWATTTVKPDLGSEHA